MLGNAKGYWIYFIAHSSHSKGEGILQIWIRLVIISLLKAGTPANVNEILNLMVGRLELSNDIKIFGCFKYHLKWYTP